MRLFNPDLDNNDDPDVLNIPTVLSLADDGATVSISFMDVPVMEVDALLAVMGTIEARDELLMKLAQALAEQTKQEISRRLGTMLHD